MEPAGALWRPQGSGAPVGVKRETTYLKKEQFFDKSVKISARLAQSVERKAVGSSPTVGVSPKVSFLSLDMCLGAHPCGCWCVLKGAC